MHLIQNRDIIKHFIIKILLNNKLIRTYFLKFLLCLQSIPNLLWWIHWSVEIIETIQKSIENVPSTNQFIFLPFISLCLYLISVFITCSRKRHQIRVQDIEKFQCNKSEFHFVFPLREIGFIKAIRFHQFMIQHLQCWNITCSFHCRKYCLRFLGILHKVIMEEQY